MLEVVPILCRAGQMDNYAYLLVDKSTGISAILDASEAAPIIAECQKKNVKPQFLLNTHHHFDHVEGNAELRELFGAKIVGAAENKDRIENMDIALNDGDVFELGDSKAHIISADGHTIGHILWYFPQDKVLFTGDTLFNLSIGGLFEGTPEQMWSSLQKIKNLPDDVLFYPGHEYTVYGMANLEGESGIKYAETAKKRLSAGLPAGPFTLADEKKCNPYLRIDSLQEFCRLFN